MSDNERSSNELERDVEARRSDINETISTLKNRFSPEAAADYGLNYVRGPGGQRLLGAVRDNPLAALLVVGGLGWLFYTANQPENQRRRHALRSGTRVPRPVGTSDTVLRDSDLVPTDNSSLEPSSHARSKVRVYESLPAASHPGMMGDETEEQNLNQPGNTDARISKDEIEDAFRTDRGSGTIPKV